MTIVQMAIRKYSSFADFSTSSATNGSGAHPSQTIKIDQWVTWIR